MNIFHEKYAVTWMKEEEIEYRTFSYLYEWRRRELHRMLCVIKKATHATLPTYHKYILRLTMSIRHKN